VVAERGLDTSVGSGENAHRKLHNDWVVRQVESLATVAPGETREAEGLLDLDPSWRRDNLSVVAFLQDPENLAMRAATSWSSSGEAASPGGSSD